MKTILSWDKKLLLTINSHHAPWLDEIMWILSNDFFIYPFLFSLLMLFYVKKKSGYFFILTFILLLMGILLSDQLANFFKNTLVCRLRPTHHPELSGWLHILNDYRGGRYGFYSGHASNSMFCITWLWLVFKREKVYFPVVFFLIPLIIGYSRVYLGVHYPSDILAGWLTGFFLSLLMYYIYLFLKSRLTP